MDSREKFLNVISFKKRSPIPNWEFAYWYDTIKRWYEEGLPKQKPPTKLEYQQWVAGEAYPSADVFYDSLNFYDIDVHDFFGFDERAHSVAVDSGPIPVFEKEIFSEDSETITYRREDGKIVKTKKDGSSMPQFISYPVKNRKDFNKIKEKFNFSSNERLPKEFNKYISKYENRTYPLQLTGSYSGFFSILREMLGLENTLYLFFDDPMLVNEILEFFTDYYIKLYSKIVSRIKVDYILIGEDMAFKNGPLVSPNIFKKFLLPFYKKFIYKMKEYGVEHFFVDTDGNFEVLIPLFLEGGVTGFTPFEIQSGLDVEKIREIYPNLVIMGGIDKKVLFKNKESILKELEKVKRMLKKGGYIPYTDHMVTPEVSFDNYKFYRMKLKKIIDDNCK